jgi:hypothetical protein
MIVRKSLQVKEIWPPMVPFPQNLGYGGACGQGFFPYVRPEDEAELTRQAALQGRAIESVATALLEGAMHPSPESPAPAEVVEACERLKTFGKQQGLSLGGMTLRELRHEARP